MNTKALHLVSYGLYAVASFKGEKINAQIANTVLQVCSDPLIVSAVINRNNLTHEYISSSKVFSASILAENTPLNFIGGLGFKSGRDTNKFSGLNYKIGQTRSPVILDNALAYLEAEVVNQIEVYTHTIFIGRLVDADVIKDGNPMTYAFINRLREAQRPLPHPASSRRKRRKRLKWTNINAASADISMIRRKATPMEGSSPVPVLRISRTTGHVRSAVPARINSNRFKGGSK